MKTQPRKRWFVAKTYGWGWTPVSVEGWMATLFFALGYLALGISFSGWLQALVIEDAADYRTVALGLLEFLAAFALLTYVVVRICTRFGEPARWRWGNK